jgi:N6-adenosine-specific RNA methylase IME4
MDNKYQVIYADPPWQYNARNNEGTRFGLGTYGHYNNMTIEQLSAMKIKEITDKSCMLFMWVVFPKIKLGFKLMESWGFEYVGLGFSWVKLNKKDLNPFFGIGYYAKSNMEVCLIGDKNNMGSDLEWISIDHDQSVEYCLLGRKGDAIKPATNYVSSLVISPKEGHSKKPDEVRKRIQLLYPEERKLELFARQNYIGWDSYGNQVERSIVL